MKNINKKNKIFNFFTLGFRGTGLAEALTAAAMLAGVALIGTKIVSDLGIKQRNANLSDVRRKLFNYHYDISRTPDGRKNSVNANADIVAHANGTTPITPFDTTRRCMQLRDQNNNIILDDAGAATQEDGFGTASPNYCAAGGKYFGSKGGPGCGAGGCNATNGTWHVYAVWIPRANNLFDIEIVVRQMKKADGTARGMRGTTLHDEKGLAASAAGADPYWTLNSSTGTIYRDAGAGAYFGFGRTNTNQARLEVVNSIIVSSAMPATEGNTIFRVTSGGQTVIGRKTPVHAAARLDVNGLAGIGNRLLMTPDTAGGDWAWITLQGTDVENNRLVLGMRNLGGGQLDYMSFHSHAAARMQISSTDVSFLFGLQMAIYDQSNTWWANISQSGNNSGNFHIDPYGSGNIYFNWWGGPGLYIGNGASNYGHIEASSFNPMSDARLKTNIVPLENSLSLVEAMEGVRFRYRSDDAKGIGFIAQKVMKVFPETVTALSPSEKLKDYLVVNYDSILAPVTGAIQELDQRVRALSESTDTLKSQQKALEAQVDREIAAAKAMLKAN